MCPCEIMVNAMRTILCSKHLIENLSDAYKFQYVRKMVKKHFFAIDRNE